MKHFYRYLPLSDEVRQQNLYVLAGGYTFIPPHSPYPPLPHPTDHDFRWQLGRTLQEYQIIYITRGKGVFESRRGGRRAIEAGALFMLFPGEWHRYSPDLETGWDEYWVAFHGTTAAQMVAEFPLSPTVPVLHAYVNEALREEFIRITEEMRQEAIGYQKIIAARTMLLLATATASALRRSYEGTDILRVIEEAKSLLARQTDQDVNMEEMAGRLGVGYSLFRRAFRQYTGLSPAQYHLEFRINQANALLRTTSLPVAAVGQRVGFELAGYFCRIYKKKTGQSPGAYRAMSQSGHASGLARSG